MNKGKFISLTVIILLVAIFTFSCSSQSGLEERTLSSGSEEATQSSSSEGTAKSSSSEETAQSSSSEGTSQSSSSAVPSSSSAPPSSSSEAKSSSSEESLPSSSSVELSSSSAPPNSSSEAESSSSKENPPSSSSVEPSSSSAEPSSSSEAESSSSVAPSSSSAVPCTASDNTQTHYCSEGTMKEYVILTDSRDSKTYKAVVIGTQTWMAENLNYQPHTTTAGCYIGYNRTTCGLLYNWSTALTVCPSGWHLPNDAEWDVLMTAIGGSDMAGTKLKVVNYTGSTDEYGFSALTCGYSPGDGSIYPGARSYWWSTSERSAANDLAYSRNMDYYRSDIEIGWIFKYYLYSVRCVQD